MTNLTVHRHELLFLEPDLDLHGDFACDEQYEHSHFREHEETVYNVASTSVFLVITKSSIGVTHSQHIII